MAKRANDVDEYIASAPREVQGKLRQVRLAIKEAAPDAVEGVSYMMPYYAKKGELAWRERSIVWFGMQSTHIGLYLPPPIVSEHKKDLKGYVTTKSAVRLPISKKMPVLLIKKLVEARLKRTG